MEHYRHIGQRSQQAITRRGISGKGPLEAERFATERKVSITAQIAVVVVVLFVVNAFTGISLARESQRAMTEQLQSRMIDVASSAADLLDGDYMAQIKPEDEGSPAYEQALDTLSSFQKSVDLSFIYCVRQVDDETFEFTIDPASRNPEAYGEPAKFGEQAEPTSALKQAAEGTPSVDLVAYEDKWGRFYSAYSPVFDSNGKVAGIVSVDFDAVRFEEHSDAINRMALITCAVSLILAIIALLVVTHLTRTETKHTESLLEANRFDSLTKLPNMGHFFELAMVKYHDLLAKGKDPAMLYMDMSGMKFFNEKWGFAEGDKLLKAFAELLVERFGRECCGRLGQDHFAAVSNAEGLDERLEDLIGELSGINEGRNLPVRIGIHLNSTEVVAASGACDRAKAASKSNPDTHKSTFAYFNEEMKAREERRRYIIDNLDRAIEEGWIQVHYQPIVRACTFQVCDEEALARWYDPERGMLSPAEFIPVLEDAKLVYKLDLCVLEQMLAKMNLVAGTGLYLVPSSVNLSRSDFEACDMVEEVRMRVDAAGIEHSKVTIEITETAMGMDFDFMRQQIERFHDLGFQVWMDDFGSEYSSLDYLQSLRFDLLKLDMRFMQQFDNGYKTRVILTELVKMAQGLGIDTVAEGVETQEQVDFLLEIGCTKLQGYFFAKPNPIEVVLEHCEDAEILSAEDPAEIGYYSTIGNVNLYDFSSIVREEDEGLQHFFDMLPMAVVESSYDEFAIMRCNTSYMEFISRMIGAGQVAERIPYEKALAGGESAFISAIRECSRQGGRITVDEMLPNGFTVHAFVRRIATNPVTGNTAMVVAVLAID